MAKRGRAITTTLLDQAAAQFAAVTDPALRAKMIAKYQAMSEPTRNDVAGAVFRASVNPASKADRRVPGVPNLEEVKRQCGPAIGPVPILMTIAHVGLGDSALADNGAEIVKYAAVRAAERKAREAAKGQSSGGFDLELDDLDSDE